jgi:hypothetical protein
MTATAQAVPGEVRSLTERELMRRVIVRLMPIVTFIYLIAIIDRSNIGFAKLQMAQDLHMSEAVYGFGASLFSSAIWCSKSRARLPYTTSARADGLPASCSPGAS